MERLTKQMGDKYFYKSMPYQDNFYIAKVVTKLGHLEDIEQELGITLEVLFKALKEGFWFKDSGRVFFAKQAGIFNGVSGTYWFSGIDTMVKVKDYGKTWLLTREELENAKD